MRTETPGCCWIWVAVLLLLASHIPSLHAQRSAHMRVYRTAGGYPGSVTFSPGGNAVAKSGDSPVVTILDGYAQTDIPMPEENTFRVHQSRSGQLWTITRDGRLLLYHDKKWSSHNVPELRQEMSANPIRQLKQIGLLPYLSYPE